VVASTLAVGCAASLPPPSAQPDNAILMDVANANINTFTEADRVRSSALHHFLVGQLSLNDQDFKTALDNFSVVVDLADEPTPFVHSKLADLYLRFGELDKALAAAETALKEDPASPSNRLLYAGVLEALGRDAEAEPQYKKLIEEFPGKFDAYVLLSNLYVKQGRFQDSLDLLKRLERIEPSDTLAHYYLGRTYELMERYPLAEAEYMRVFESDPTLSRGSVELLRVLLRNKKSDKAKTLCERMLQKDPTNAVARKVLGHLMLGESKLDEALKHLVVLEGIEADASDTRFKIALIQMEKRDYEEATRELNLVLATKPDHSEARYYLASIYAGSGKRKEALEQLLAIPKGDPMFVKAYTFAAFVLRQDNDLQRAQDVVAEAREIEPENKNLLLYHVLIMRDLKEYRKAESLMREALKTDPNDERLLFNLALVLHERGKEEEAIAMMERTVEVNPRNSDALNYLAYDIIEKRNDPRRAEELARRALEIKPQDPYYLDTLGWAQFKSGKLDESEATLAKAAGLAGDDIVVLSHYIEALLARKKYDKAVALMKGIIEHDLSEEEREDVDTVGAYERIKERLKILLQEQPGLSSIEKNPISKKTTPLAEQQTSFDVELLTGSLP
jgi:tetratricopeptide (TPR) repeat protein